MASQEPDPRNETPEQRDDRNLAELLQELRVAGLGVQVLFGFLLSIPFTMKFSRLSGAQRDLYITTLLLAALSTATRPRIAGRGTRGAGRWPAGRRSAPLDPSARSSWTAAGGRDAGRG